MSQNKEQEHLKTILTVWRPSGQWTTLFQHRPYAAALWALIFEPDERYTATEYFQGDELSILSSKINPNEVVGYRTTAGQARERLVARLGPVRGFEQAWRAFSLTRALALSLSAIPADWTLRLDASAIITTRNNRYTELMSVAILIATKLANEPPKSDIDAINSLLGMVHAMNPETSLMTNPQKDGFLFWSNNAQIIEYELLGKPVECPSDYVEAMTRARYQWQERW